MGVEFATRPTGIGTRDDIDIDAGIVSLPQLATEAS